MKPKLPSAVNKVNDVKTFVLQHLYLALHFFFKVVVVYELYNFRVTHQSLLPIDQVSTRELNFLKTKFTCLF